MDILVSTIIEMSKIANNTLISFKEDFSADIERVKKLGAEHLYLWGVRPTGTNLLCLSHPNVLTDILKRLYSLFKTTGSLSDVKDTLDRSFFVAMRINKKAFLIENGLVVELAEGDLKKIESSYVSYIYDLYRKCVENMGKAEKLENGLLERCAKEVKKFGKE